MFDAHQFENKKIVILGFGREGRSTYNYLSDHVENCEIQIMDKNVAYVKESVDSESNSIKIYETSKYLKFDLDVDLVFKSPGVPLMDLEGRVDESKITSQSNEFIKAFRDQIIGVTGTKGKSTTCSFLNQLLLNAGHKAILVGNIGKPPFDYIDDYTTETVFVYELSSHQLETVKVSPHCSVILNIFEEHLDHYLSFDHYAEAKMNIARYQNGNDIFLYSELDDEISKRSDGFLGNRFMISREEEASVFVHENGVKLAIGDSSYALNNSDDRKLEGDHNLINIGVAMVVAQALGYEVGAEFEELYVSFEGLPHRLKKVETVRGITYYNDSISTIPQTTIAAINSLKEVGSVILGGMDRGIDYSILIDYINQHPSLKCIMLPDTGHQLSERISDESRVYKVNNMDEAVSKSLDITGTGKICLLSPAAPSYGFFKNFEERGDVFESLVKELFSIN